MRKRGKLLCAGLAAAMLLSAGAFAAPDTAKRQEDLNALYTGLTEKHPDLFANTPEADFLAKIAEIAGRSGTVSDFDYTLDLQSLVALVGDSHTSVSIGGAGHALFPVNMEAYEGKWILNLLPVAHKAWLGSEVTAVNGLSVEALVDKFRPIVSYDNDVKLLRQIKQTWYVQEILAYLGVIEAGGDLTLTLKSADGKTGKLKLKAFTNEEEEATELVRLKDARTAVPATEPNRERYYFSLPLDEKTYYIQYNRCREDPDLPMEDFALQVQADLKKGSYTKVLLDLRNNGGGSDGVIIPLYFVLMEPVWRGDIKLFGLTGESTFSSAGINASMVQELGGLTAGSRTGGSVDHFGSVGSFTLPNSGARVGYSNKFIDLESLLVTSAGQGVQSLAPDVAVEQTLTDYLAGKDTVVDHLLKNGDGIAVPVRANAETTRAGFIARLWREAGSPQAAGAHGFQDVWMFFAYYVPALDWAAENGVILGDGLGSFRPADPISEGEKALILERMEQTAGQAPAA